MKLNEEFEKDVKEAYAYWATKQPEGQKLITLDQWIVAMLQKPVYEIIGSKRTENA